MAKNLKPGALATKWPRPTAAPKATTQQMGGRARTEDRSGLPAPPRGISKMERFAYSTARLMG